jgi:hypothetical protein
MSIRDEAQAQAELERRARRAGVEPFMQKMREATDDAFLRDIVRDNRRSVHERPGFLPERPHSAPVEPAPRTNGWVDPAPLRNGMDRHIERLIDAQDAVDRRDRERGGR